MLQGKIYYDKSIELILFRSQIIDRSSSVILYKHAYSKNTVGRALKIQDSLILAQVIYEMDLPPARICESTSRAYASSWGRLGT